MCTLLPKILVIKIYNVSWIINLKPSLSGRRPSWIEQRVKIQTRKFSIKVSFMNNFYWSLFTYLSLYIYLSSLFYILHTIFIIFCNKYIVNEENLLFYLYSVTKKISDNCTRVVHKSSLAVALMIKLFIFKIWI